MEAKNITLDVVIVNLEKLYINNKLQFSFYNYYEWHQPTLRSSKYFFLMLTFEISLLSLFHACMWVSSIKWKRDIKVKRNKNNMWAFSSWFNCFLFYGGLDGSNYISVYCGCKVQESTLIGSNYNKINFGICGTVFGKMSCSESFTYCVVTCKSNIKIQMSLIWTLLLNLTLSKNFESSPPLEDQKARFTRNIWIIVASPFGHWWKVFRSKSKKSFL